MQKILIINNAEPGIADFTEPFEQIVHNLGAEPVIIEYTECCGYDFSQIEGAILTGSPQGDDIVEHHQPYFQWIKSFEKPLLGVCAGHHITGFLYGSKLLRNEEPEKGTYNIKLKRKDPIFNNLPVLLQVKQMHNDSVTVPYNFELLATSDTCVNQMMKHRYKPLYTCQFHPEIGNHDLIMNFINLCQK